MYGQRSSENFQAIQNDRNINVSFITNYILNNILTNKIDNVNIYDSKGIYKLSSVNCEKFYIGRTNRDFKTRFKEHKNDFIYGEGRYNFSTYVIEEGHENKNIDDIMIILHKDSNHE